GDDKAGGPRWEDRPGVDLEEALRASACGMASDRGGEARPAVGSAPWARNVEANPLLNCRSRRSLRAAGASRPERQARLSVPRASGKAALVGRSGRSARLGGAGVSAGSEAARVRHSRLWR